PSRLHNRQFHTTPPTHAARSPSVRRAEAAQRRGAPAQPAQTRSTPRTHPLRNAFTDLWLYNTVAKADLGERLKFLDISGKLLYTEALKFDAVDIPFRTFHRIAKELYEVAYTQTPSGDAFARIHEDVDVVYNVGLAVAAGDSTFTEWLFTSGALASARVPLFFVVSRYLALTLKEKQEIRHSGLLDAIERLAQYRDPRAMQLHAQVLGRRGKYKEGIVLMEEVLGMIWPSKLDGPTPGDAYIVSQFMWKPWEVYAWLKEKDGDARGADEVMRTAAFEYEDPKALMKYATIMMRDGELEKYEECMSKAASSGNAMACLKLANFYYLTSQGWFARRGLKGECCLPAATVTTETVLTRRDADAGGPIGETKSSRTLGSFFSFLFSDVKSHEEYRKLAMEWYELAYNHGSVSAAFFLAVFLREDGDHELGWQFLQDVKDHGGKGSFTKKIEGEWHDKDYHHAIPLHLFDL
ncbi:hypothetical protein BBP40_010957, partial [Aspergillus hancockii]